MGFSKEVIDQAYKRSGGRCECERQHKDDEWAPHHGGRCPMRFLKDWEAHHKTPVQSEGKDDLSNCELLCVHCQNLIRIYGNN